MNIYKDNEFYDSYFISHPKFNLIEKFKVVDNKSCYVGKIEAIDTIHPLTIEVIIPKTFPHHKVHFYTTSLSGYPHLIYRSDLKRSWFCLNAPFAETAQEQLNQEVGKLENWINNYMHPELGAIIDDPKVAKALRWANAYEWENLDEINEYRKDSQLIFIGDFATKVTNFRKNIGTLSCIKNDNKEDYYSMSSRFFVVENTAISGNCKIPYILVDEYPQNFDDFLALKEQYEWDENTCNDLLPDFETEDLISLSTGLTKDCNKDYSKIEATALLDKAVEELIIPDQYKAIIEKKINSIREDIEKDNGLKSFRTKIAEKVKADNESQIDDDFEEFLFEESLYRFLYFALGIKQEDGEVIWILFNTNNSNQINCDVKRYTCDLGVDKATVNETIKIKLFYDLPQHIDEKSFYGRGRFNPKLSDLRIAIIGIGAIGSMVAESLVRSGVKNIGLWDEDTVEPGNICRTAYDIKSLGDSKSSALYDILKNISPFCKIQTNGFLYGNINYISQEKTIKQLDGYDLVIDCTANNELLHFLSYAIADKMIMSLCITNHAKNLLSVTNKDANPFELRKLHLAKIEQDTKNLYIEGTGCYSTTFYGKNCDISAFINLMLHDLNESFEQNGELMASTIWSFDKRGILADRLITYYLKEDESIKLIIPSETLMDMEDLEDDQDAELGYLLGGYSVDGKQILVSHAINPINATSLLNEAFKISEGIIDYIGDVTYSFTEGAERENILINSLAYKAKDKDVNTNNPLLAVRNDDQSIDFYLYFNGQLSKFVRS